MHNVLTISSGLILIGCLFLAWRCSLQVHVVEELRRGIERHIGAVRETAPRVTVLEREVEALRRELRKLSGKFYATLARLDDEAAAADDDEEGEARLGYGPVANPKQVPVPLGTAVCENWLIAKQEGPHSAAALCSCAYCLTARHEREAQRAALIPKTVRGQAELAKLNAGKP